MGDDVDFQTTLSEQSPGVPTETGFATCRWIDLVGRDQYPHRGLSTSGSVVPTDRR